MIIINLKEIKKPGSHTSLGQQLGILGTCVGIFVYRYDLIPNMVRARTDAMIIASVVLGFSSVLRIVKTL